MRYSWRGALLLGSAMAFGPVLQPGVQAQTVAQGSGQNSPAQQQFDIPAQPLAAALDSFARSSGWQVGYPAALAQGKTAPALRGSFTPTDALARLLNGTGLTYRATGANTVTLVEAPQGSGATVLPPVVVEGQRSPAAPQALPETYAGGQVARGGRLGLLGNRDIMDTPFSTSSYTAQKIADQQAATLGEVASNDSSVRLTGHAGGILDAFFIRGFPINEGNSGDVSFDGVFGVASTYRVLTDYAERVEVIKGPTALLNGMAPNSAIGGTINIVPKRAGDTDLTRLTFDFAEDSQLGTKVDVSRRYGENKEFGIRANGSFAGGDTQLDNQSREAFVGALAADYRGERFRSTLDLINQDEKINAPSRPLFFSNTGLPVPNAPDSHRNIMQSWEWSEITDQSGLLRTELDITPAVTVFANVGGGVTRVDRIFGTPSITTASGNTTTTPAYNVFETERFVVDGGVRGSFDTAMVSHTVTLQASQYQDTQSRGQTNGTAITSNIYNPTSSPAQQLAEPVRVPKTSETTMSGVAIADTLSVLEERVQLTLGVRHQTVDSDNYSTTTGATTSAYGKSVNTPMAGLVVKPWQAVSLYANYIEGLSKGDVATSPALNAGEALAPYVSKQKEAGVKVDFGRIATMLSVFEITKPSSMTVNNVLTSGGEQRNRGVELSAFGELLPTLRVLGGVTFLDAELTKTATAANIGNRPVGVPEVQANLGLEWDTPFLSGLTLGGGLVYTSDQYVNAGNTQRVPSWVRFDLGARYQTMLVNTPTTLRLTMRNVMDEDYWSGVSSFGGLGQGDPRTVLLSASFDF